MIYDDVKDETGIDPSAAFVPPANGPFSVYGYKKRKALAGDASRVLREAGFTPATVKTVPSDKLNGL